MQTHEDPGRKARHQREEHARQRVLTIRLIGTIVVLIGAIGGLVLYRWF